MSDLTVSISQLQEGRSKERETFRVVNKLRDQALLRYENKVTGATLGAGAYITLWSATIPRDTSWHLETLIIGRGVTGGAIYEIAIGVQNFAGAVTVIGGAQNVTVQLEDNAAMDATFALTADVLSLQVRDDAVQAMNWTAWVSSLGTV